MKKYKQITGINNEFLGSRLAYPYRVAILAGNNTQFLEFMRQPEIGEPVEYIYVDRMEKAVGYRFNDYKIVGTFWERKDAGKLEEEVKTRII